MVGRGLHEIVGWSFADPALLDRLRLPRRAPDARGRRAREPAVRRPVDDAPDAARLAARRRAPQRRAQRPRHRAVRVGHRLPRRPAATGPLARRAPRPRRAAQRRARRRAPGAARGGEADFFAAKALLAGLLDSFHVDWSVRAARDWPFLHPGRSAACCSAARAERCARLPRRAAPAGRRRLGPAAHGRVRDRPRQARGGRARGRRRSAPFGAFPVAAPGPRGHAARRRRRRRSCSSACARPPARTLERGERVRRLQRRAGRRGPALARARAVASAPPSARSPTRTSRRCASGSSRRSRSSAVSCVASEQPQRSRAGAPRVIVAGATGFAGALAAHLLWRHPGSSSPR